jgi:hypothetical protein
VLGTDIKWLLKISIFYNRLTDASIGLSNTVCTIHSIHYSWLMYYFLPSTFVYSFCKSNDNSLPFNFYIGNFYVQQDGTRANNSDLYVRRSDSNLYGASALLSENYQSNPSCRKTQDHNHGPPKFFEIIIH